MSAETLVGWLLEGLCRAPPEKVAVSSAEESLSYGELLAGARGIAATLCEAGIGRGDRVGLWLEKSPAAVQSILGILLSGAAYVPLDPRAPWRRCRTIALDCGFSAVIVDRARLPALREFLEGQRPRLALLHDGSDALPAGLPSELRIERLASAAAHPPVLLPTPAPDDVAYLLYTSGSTGVPKGVVHTQASGLAFARWMQQRFGIVPSDVFSSHAPLHFDLSISDLFTSLASGASIRLVSATEAMLAPYLVRKISEWGITVWYSVPSILVSMLDRGSLAQFGLPTVRLLFFAGEVFPTPHLRSLQRAVPHAKLYNLFGPTETNVCTYYEVPPALPEDDRTPTPIGRACEHMETFVLDEAGEPTVPGSPGVLWARGGNLMKEYWNAPQKTAETLRPDPLGRPDLAYCTGDRVRLLPDGNYEFLGRQDQMVKVRGYRVELGEVESALTAAPGVLDAVVIPVPDGASHRLIAFVVGREGTALDAASLRTHCRAFLPLYMIPDEIEVRTELPRTSTGKADRAALLAQLALDVREAS